MEDRKQANRIQTSVLNGVEKKALVWLAKRQPKWMTSDILTYIGIAGSIIVAVGYALSNFNIMWLWLASLGFVINWYGDSLDGTLARVRHTQRPIYGFFLDHSVDGVTITFMCVGAGLSDLLQLPLAMAVLVVYLLLSIVVYINAHLKNEFKLTYGGMGPTEFRVIMIIVNTLFIYIKGLREFSVDLEVLGKAISFGAFDIVALVILALLIIFYLHTLIADARGYAKIDPVKPFDGIIKE